MARELATTFVLAASNTPIIAAIIAAAAAICAAVYALSNGQNQRISDTRDDLNKQVAKLDSSLTSRIGTLETTLGQRISDQTDALNRQIDAIAETVQAGTAAEITDLTGKIEVLTTRLEGFETNLTSRLDKVEEDLRATR